MQAKGPKTAATVFELVAIRIVELAREGEFDPDKLTDTVVAEFRVRPTTQIPIAGSSIIHDRGAAMINIPEGCRYVIDVSQQHLLTIARSRVVSAPITDASAQMVRQSEELLAEADRVLRQSWCNRIGIGRSIYSRGAG